MTAEIKLKLAMDGARVVTADIRGVNRELGGMGNAAASASARAKAELGALSSMMGGLKVVAAGMVAAVAIKEVLGRVVSVQREFDVLNSSLITVTGSSAAAAREMAWLKDFAKETPFGLEQVVGGFVRMKSLGLDPTSAALTSFGNTASAMGKNLNQMIEAVADASTGEFERLKEFGIKARKSGDEVAFTFQGITTTVRNSSEEITAYLENIGNTAFAGAMEERAKTLDGAIAELGDTWDELFRTISDAGVGSVIYQSVQLAISAIQDAIDIIDAMNGVMGDGAEMARLFQVAQDSVRGALETIAVVGVNAVAVYSNLVDQLHALYNVAVNLLSLDFSGAIQAWGDAYYRSRQRGLDAYNRTQAIIGAPARADAERAAARQERLAEQSWSRTLGLGGTKRTSVSMAGASRGKSGGRSGGGSASQKATEEARAYEQALKAIRSAQLSASMAGEDLTATQRKLQQIMASPEWAKMPLHWQQTIKAQAESVIQLELQAKAAADYKRLVDTLKTDEEKRRDTMREQLQTLQAMKDLGPAEYSDMGKRIITGATEDAPQFGGMAPEMGGAFGELAKIDEARERLEQWYAEQLRMLADFRAQRADLTSEANARELELARQYDDEIKKIEAARLQLQLAGLEQAMGSITSLLRETAGEQSGIYKAMFAVEKAVAIARAILAIQSGIAQAANLPFPANLVGMATVAAATAGIVSNISSVALQFREKGGPVSKGQPYIVGEKGMELFVPSQSGTIIPNNRLQSSGGGDGAATVTVNLVGGSSKAGQVETRRDASGGVTVDAFVADIYGDGPLARAVSGAFGLRRAGR
jgi:hypothetical protein